MTELELRVHAMNWAVGMSKPGESAHTTTQRAEAYLAYLKIKPAPTVLRVENGRVKRVR